MQPALAGIVVADGSDTVAGQYCARLLADFGAEVTLLEPQEGSATRRLGPFRAADGSSLAFFHLNTGKRSVRLAAGSAGRAEAERWHAGADVVLVPTQAEAAGARTLNPAVVACVVGPFGEDGPLRDWQGPEIVLQALSGMMHNNGAHGREPLYGCGRRASHAAGLAAAIGVLAALLVRGRTGQGQTVTVDEAETAAAMCFPYVMQYLYNGTVKSRLDPNIPAGQVLCRDGWACIWIYDHRWAAACRALGLDALVDDPRFAEPTTRRRNWPALFALIQERVAGQEADHVVDRLQREEVIAARAQRPSGLRGSRHLAERGYWETAGGETILGPPFRLGRTPRRVRSGAPALGERTDGPPPPRPASSEDTPAAATRPPLDGLRVVELTTAWAGPMAGRVLGFLGAECIHVESPTRVNSWRSNKDTSNPVNFPHGEPGARPFDRSFLFNSQNVNKRSCILDLKQADGRKALLGLIARADVLICNFRPGTLARLGLDEASLRAIQPDLIVAELPAYGLAGPMARHAALGPTMEMAAGMSSLIGYPGGQPETTGPSYLDPVGGFNAAAAILIALLHRARTGEGQSIEVPQVEAAMQLIGPEILAALDIGQDPEPQGNRVPDAAPHDAYPARGEDQWVAVAARSDAEWRALAAAMGQPALGRDPRFATLADRQAHADALDTLLAAWTRGRDKHEAAGLLQAAGVPAAPVQTPRDLAESPYLAYRGFFTVLDHPDAGRHPHPGLPIHLSATPGAQRRAAPAFGADNLYVLGEVLHLPPERIEAIRASAAMADTPLPGA